MCLCLLCDHWGVLLTVNSLKGFIWFAKVEKGERSVQLNSERSWAGKKTATCWKFTQHVADNSVILGCYRFPWWQTAELKWELAYPTPVVLWILKIEEFAHKLHFELETRKVGKQIIHPWNLLFLPRDLEGIKQGCCTSFVPEEFYSEDVSSRNMAVLYTKFFALKLCSLWLPLTYLENEILETLAKNIFFYNTS